MRSRWCVCVCVPIRVMIDGKYGFTKYDACIDRGRGEAGDVCICASCVSRLCAVACWRPGAERAVDRCDRTASGQPSRPKPEQQHIAFRINRLYHTPASI